MEGRFGVFGLWVVDQGGRRAKEVGATKGEELVQGDLGRRGGRLGCRWFRRDSAPSYTAHIPHMPRFDGQTVPAETARNLRF
jgi:hypothetical protein